MIIEVIAIRTEDIVMAAAGGADRIELVTSIAEGGLTPSAGLIEAAVKASSLPVNVMVRPHSQSFCYSESDMSIMLRDIEIIRNAGATGIVVGALNAEGEVDTGQLERFIHAADGLDITFHRAFDEVRDQHVALRVLTQYPAISRILTSGGTLPASQATKQLRELQVASLPLGINIMGGYGLNGDNISNFVKETRVPEVHFGSGVRHNGSYNEAIDVGRIARIRTILQEEL
ncbi:copper homeostasis protein CutC [Paenibacillus sp. GSMTC-2017]|uniref:copper homeostasis protein CutC n=1 Tax=Paenibacillus sp. GSMTC-2017 TaxID=2794350 RepID=UPI0018D7CF86|nr:copper homeostasis protein CutC [Paenibacillus sp. GSMTC-2017]MBH5320885.1 copper homeostasis protein CutC [Paenibacillus sp. GSMTC-2017]